MNNSGIYSIVNNINNKIYIGSALNFNKRWNLHNSQLNCNKHHSIILQRAFNKYGKDNFTFEIIEYVEDKTKLIEREQNWLDFFKPEYNVCKIAGRPLGMKHSAEAKAKMSLTRTGMIGKKCTDETKDKISKANKGKKRSVETTTKRSLSTKCMKHSDETKAKMSLAGKGRKRSAETQAKISLTIKNRQAKIKQDKQNE